MVTQGLFCILDYNVNRVEFKYRDEDTYTVEDSLIAIILGANCGTFLFL
jgi:hypothetical protein